MSQRGKFLGFLKGIVLLLGAHILALAIGALAFHISYVLPVPLSLWVGLPLLILIYGVGIAQLVYVIPLVIHLKRRQQYQVMKGVIVGAILTALLNAGLWLLFFWALSQLPPIGR